MSGEILYFLFITTYITLKVSTLHVDSNTIELLL